MRPRAPAAGPIAGFTARRIAYRTIPDEAEREALLDRFDVDLDDWQEADEFLDEALDAQVLRACRRLGLPEDLAPGWRDLIEPYSEPVDDDAEADDAGYPPWNASG